MPREAQLDTMDFSVNGESEDIFPSMYFYHQ